MKTKQPSAHGAQPATKVMNKVDFTGKQLFVGTDVHKKCWQAAVFYEGIILSNDNIAADATVLISYLHKHYAGASFSCVYERGVFGYALFRSLWTAGMEWASVR